MKKIKDFIHSIPDRSEDDKNNQSLEVVEKTEQQKKIEKLENERLEIKSEISPINIKGGPWGAIITGIMLLIMGFFFLLSSPGDGAGYILLFFGILIFFIGIVILKSQ